MSFCPNTVFTIGSAAKGTKPLLAYRGDLLDVYNYRPEAFITAVT